MIPKIYSCLECEGTGLIKHNLPNGGALVSDPCPYCDATGTKTSTTEWVDTTYFDEKFLAIMEELDYIHGKVTAIWNQVKPGA